MLLTAFLNSKIYVFYNYMIATYLRTANVHDRRTRRTNAFAVVRGVRTAMRTITLDTCLASFRDRLITQCTHN